METNEVWMPVHQFPNYQISSFGISVNLKTGRQVKPIKSKKGYLQIKFFLNGNRSIFYLHRVLAFHFIPNPDNKPFVNHKDGDKCNNRLDNLEWCTQKENINHYHKSLKPLRVKKQSWIMDVCDYVYPLGNKPYKTGIVDKRFRLSKMIKNSAMQISGTYN